MGRVVVRHLLALLAALTATAFTFFFVHQLNTEKQASKGKVLSALTRFDVDKPPKRRARSERPRLRRPKKVKQQMRTRNDNRALIPNLASRIGAQGLNVDGASEEGLLVGTTMDRVTSAEGRASLRTNVFEASDVEEPAKVVGRSAPAYPREAIRAGITGYVRFKLLVDERGEIQRLLVDRSEPKGVFERAARESILQWRFAPAEHDGFSVSSWVFQTIRFEFR